MSRPRAPYSVQKALAPTGGYGRGWFAFSNQTDVGQFFPTWRQAINHALREHRLQEIRDMQAKSSAARREVVSVNDLNRAFR